MFLYCSLYLFIMKYQENESYFSQKHQTIHHVQPFKMLKNCKNLPFFCWKIVKMRRFRVGKLSKNAVFALENCKKNVLIR